MKKVEKIYWLQAIGWVLLIYGTLPVVRPLCDFLKKFSAYPLLINLFMISLLAIFMFFLWQQGAAKKPLTYVLVIAFLFLAGCLVRIIHIPEEKIHLAEYGFLAFLIYRAARINLENPHAYLAAFLLTSVLGWADEGIQAVLPSRYYQLSDVLLNSVGGALGLLMTFILKREVSHET